MGLKIDGVITSVVSKKNDNGKSFQIIQFMRINKDGQEFPIFVKDFSNREVKKGQSVTIPVYVVPWQTDDKKKFGVSIIAEDSTGPELVKKGMAV